MREEKCVYLCLGCNTVYKYKPSEYYKDGHGGRIINMCRCRCDLFDEIKTSEIGTNFKQI